MKGRARLAVVGLAAGTAAGAIAIAISGATKSRVEAWSIGTAYIAFLLLASSMLLGPLNVIGGRRNPVHSSLRRDVGVAGGATAIVHTALGFQVHMGGAFLRYFQLDKPASISGALFVATNCLGVISCAILALLVAISTDIAIRSMGLTRWKRIQRLAYWSMGAAASHGLIYQLLGRRSVWLVGLVAMTSGALLVLQFKGARIRSAKTRD